MLSRWLADLELRQTVLLRYEHDEVGTRLNYEVMSKAVSFARCAPSAADMECAFDEEELLAPIREDYKRRHRR